MRRLSGTSEQYQSMPPDIAIVIPCYNGEATLAATLESAIAQGDEVGIMVVDDGSSDRSLSIARRFEPRIRVLTGPNRGVSAARNRGIAATDADWLVFLDADDLLIPGTLKLRLKAARETNADVIICDWEEVDDGSEVASSPPPVRTIDWALMEEDAELAAATSAWATTAAILYRRSLVERIGGFRDDLPIIQDARFLFDAMSCGGKAVYSPHVGARYRVLTNSLSRRNAVRFWQDVLRNGRQIEKFWRTAGTFNDRRIEAVRGIYYGAARGFFAAADSTYFEAHASMCALGRSAPLHSRIAAPLARLFGLPAARTMLSLVGRA